MRDKSGRSGLRRGSQNPGTAIVIGGGVTVGGAGDTPCGAFCACTTAVAVTKRSEARQTLRAMVRIMRGL